MASLARVLVAAVVGTAGVATAVGAQATLTWTDNSDNESGFYVERSADGGEWQRIGETGPDVTEYVDDTAVVDTSYEYRVNAFNEYGISGYTNTASFLKINQAPTISALEDVTINANASTGPLTFTVSDDETSLDALQVTATWSNSALLGQNEITLAGSAGEWTLSVTLASDAFGSSALTVTVSDGSKSASETFTLTVNEPIATTLSIASIEAGSLGLVPNDLPVGVSVDSDDFSVIKRVEYSVAGSVMAFSSNSPFSVKLTFPEEGVFDVVARAVLINGESVVSEAYRVAVGPEPTATTLISGLRFESVGTLEPSGTFEYTQMDDAFMLASNEGSIGGFADVFDFAHLRVMGDVTFSARLHRPSGGEEGSIAGLMLREGAYSGSAQATVALDAKGQLRLLARSEMGAALVDEPLISILDDSVYVRLRRTGDTISVDSSTDGVAWQSVAARTVHFGDMLLAGIAATDTSGTAKFCVDRLALAGTVVDWNDVNLPPLTPSGLLLSDL